MRRVAGTDDWARVGSLRQAAMADRGEVFARVDGLPSDPFDSARNSSAFLMFRNGRPAASVRTNSLATPGAGALPSMSVFGREIDAALGTSTAAVEASLTIVDPASGLDPRVGLVHVMKGAMIECAAQSAEWLLTAVREEEIGFYRRVFNMEILSGAEACPGSASPRVLMGLRYRDECALLYRRIPVLAVTAADVLHYVATGGVRFGDALSHHHAA